MQVSKPRQTPVDVNVKPEKARCDDELDIVTLSQSLVGAIPNVAKQSRLDIGWIVNASLRFDEQPTQHVGTQVNERCKVPETFISIWLWFQLTSWKWSIFWAKMWPAGNRLLCIFQVWKKEALSVGRPENSQQWLYPPVKRNTKKWQQPRKKKCSREIFWLKWATVKDMAQLSAKTTEVAANWQQSRFSEKNQNNLMQKITLI